ncbi:MAG: hypothetical protein CVU39_10750 [Chloroflexi bacterium HGW-Chloroflexi-10]|nr:MAG: hypothetical protein CVU39_10750 [Chloroflexi bacterium HGW-Chloroflexi-10]
MSDPEKVLKSTIRTFQSQADVMAAATLTNQEHWRSETPLELAAYYVYDPDGCFIAEVDGILAGICIATVYQHTGFIGELIVQPQYRKHQLGTRLMQTAIEYLNNEGISCIFLDGVLKAVPLYERLGFLPLCRSLRLFGQVSAREFTHITPIQTIDLPQIFDMDLQFFGSDRSFFLERRLRHYPELCWKWQDINGLQAYLFGRVGIGGWVTAGPWVSRRSAQETLPLLEHFQSAIGNQPFSIGVLESTNQTVQLLVQNGMQPNPEPPMRMFLGLVPNMVGSEQCLAIGSPAKG